MIYELSPLRKADLKRTEKCDKTKCSSSTLNKAAHIGRGVCNKNATNFSVALQINTL